MTQASHHRAANYNVLHPNGDVKFGITKFADLDSKEFQSMLLTHQPSPASCVLKLSPNSGKKKPKKRDIYNQQKPLPEYVDWYVDNETCRLVLFTVIMPASIFAGERKIL